MALVRTIALVLTLLAVLSPGVARAAAPFLAELPWPDGVVGLVGQGPYTQRTHKGFWAWDFRVPEGTPVTAIAPGRVVWVKDDSKVQGERGNHASNQIHIDHGDGLYSRYVHHKTGTATVRVGQWVAAGQPLAIVGASGTTAPHIHLDVRGPSMQASHPVRFDVGGQHIELKPRARYRSTNARGTAIAAGATSRAQGDLFAPNGVVLTSGPDLYLLRAGKHLRFAGTAASGRTHVVFEIWEVEAHRNVARVEARVRGDRTFTLDAVVPPRLKGRCAWRLTAVSKGTKPPRVASVYATVL